MNPISCTLTDCISPLLCDVITWVHDCTAYKATHLTHQRETPPTAHPPFFLHLSGSSHNKKKHRKWRPWTLDTGLSCCRSDQSTAEIPSYLSVTVCKQSATEHNQLVPNCLHYIISRRNLSLSNLGLSYRPPPPPVLIKEGKKQNKNIPNKAWVKFPHYWLKCGGQNCLHLKLSYQSYQGGWYQRTINKRWEDYVFNMLHIAYVVLQP